MNKDFFEIYEMCKSIKNKIDEDYDDLYSKIVNASWQNDLRTLFSRNQAIVYTINIRNFAAIDKDFNGLIEPENGDKIGTFLGAKDKLKELSKEYLLLSFEKIDGIKTKVVSVCCPL